MSRAGDVKSPCIGVCCMDDRTGYCAGCARTLDEIARWSVMSVQERRQVLESLSVRQNIRKS